MFTSYYANKSVTNGVSISIRPPNWFVGKSYRKLAPPDYPDIVKQYKYGKISSTEYTSLYFEKVLNKLNCEEIYSEIIYRFGQDVTLLCYERPCDFCHRHLVADWFNKNLNVNVVEFGHYPKKLF